jgi:flagellar hook assembly protein FlgD
MMRPYKVDTTTTPPIIVAKQEAVPVTYSLSQNYPNPFNLETSIAFFLSSPSQVDLTVYNILGERVKTLAEGEFQTGSHTVTWDGTNQAGHTVASGIYFFRLNAGDNSVTRKMVLLK